MNEGLLTDRVVLVTGGARRIGAAICRALHGEGASVVLHYRSSRDAADALAAELNAVRAASASLVAGDLLDADTPSRLVAACQERHGRLDAVINNASAFYATPLGEIDGKAWDELVGTNMRAPLFLAQAAAALLRASGGCIVSIADIYAERPLPGFSVYSMAKAGLVGMTRALARELAPQVRVNAVAPGAILWPEQAGDEARQKDIMRRTPMARPGTPEDIAGAVRFLVCEAPYVTGQVLAVCGGRSITM